jgi:uncharacterized protein
MRAVLAAWLSVAGLVLGALPAVAADGDIVDDARILGDPYRQSLQSAIDAWRQLEDGRLVVVTRTVDAPDAAAAQAEADRRLPELGGHFDLVLVVDVSPGGCPGASALAATADANTLGVTPEEAAFALEELDTWIARCQADAGISIAGSQLLSLALSDAPLPSGGPFDPGPVASPLPGAVGAPPAGPPFPPPIDGRAVYDYAGVFAPETIAQAERTIDDIEARVGAEVVVYSQVVGSGISPEEADRHAQALMDQWGVGRRGIDDGLVILFDLDPSLVHGQVQLYGGPGYRAAFLDNSEKQRIFDEEMLPLLRQEDLDGALLVALRRVDENATPEHAATLERARQIDAAVGLIGAPIVFLGLVGSAVFAWLRYGRDPVYLDDPSIHMAGPPDGLTPAAGTFVLNGGPSRRALTAAMLDLASRGLIAFREESGFFGMNRKVGIDLEPPAADPLTLARRARNAVRPLGPAETLAFSELEKVDTAEPKFIDPKELLAFGASVAKFDKKLESHTVKMGWFREKPSAATSRWMVRGTIALILGGVAVFGGVNLPSGGLTLIGGAAILAGIVVFILARSMVSVSLPGAMIRAMLAAYRRTLEKTMAQARSMDQVVAESGLTWLETPDQAVVWGTALGLEKEVEEVLERSMADLREGRVAAGSTYVPTWYGAGGVGGGGGAGAPATAGLFSSSAVPNIGGMMAALGTIGNSPGSSGGSGGGFSGGSSGGGGGGSGGGF